MNIPATQEATMTLKEITDLLEVEHNKAMKVVAKMAETEGFGWVEKVATQYSSGKGRISEIETYQLNRRQSMAVAARLNTALLMKVIDRLDELERGVVQPALTEEEIVMRAMQIQDTKIKSLTSEVKVLTPKADALDRIATADGSLNITNAAKHLQVRPKDMFDWLSAQHWIYRRVGGSAWVGYQDKVQQGLLEHKVTIQIIEGVERIREQVRITAKGLAKLANFFDTPELA